MSALLLSKVLFFAFFAIVEVFFILAALDGWVAAARGDACDTEQEMAVVAPVAALIWGAVTAFAFHLMFEAA